jgi:hypothetical protein
MAISAVPTLTLAEAVPPVPPSVEVTLPVTLFWVPAVVPVTFTENVQPLLAPTDPPDKLITPVPCVAVIAPAPQLPVSPLGVEITSPDGKVSVNPMPLRELPVFGLLMVKLNDVEPLSGMLAPPNILLIVGGATTVKVAEAVPPVPPSVELTVLVVLSCAPTLIAVTLTENVHDEPALGDAVSVPPDRLTVEGVPGGLLMVAVIVPLPHEPVTVVEASLIPPGKLSVNATPLSALVVFGLVMLKLSVLLVFNATVFGLNILLMVGGAITVRVSEAVPPVPPSVELTLLVVLT